MSGGSVLVVDDDQALRETLCRVLRGAGYAVEEAESGKHALKLAAAEMPVMLITDIMMPDCDGIELMKKLRRRKPSMPVLAISGRGSIGTLDVLNMVSKLGADDVLAKPFDGDELLAKVEQLVGAAPGVAR